MSAMAVTRPFSLEDSILGTAIIDFVRATHSISLKNSASMTSREYPSLVKASDVETVKTKFFLLNAAWALINPSATRPVNMMDSTLISSMDDHPEFKGPALRRSPKLPAVLAPKPKIESTRTALPIHSQI